MLRLIFFYALALLISIIFRSTSVLSFGVGDALGGDGKGQGLMYSGPSEPRLSTRVSS